MTLADMRGLTRAPGGRLVWAHQCHLGRHERMTTKPRPHHVPFTRVATGMIAACPYCGSVKHTKETA